MRDKSPSILIAGVGSIGSRHLRNLVALGHRDIRLLRQAAQPAPDLPGAPLFTDLAAALRAGPDIVMVCTPAPQHLPCAQAAADAGCAVFVEKPLSHAWSGVEALVATARQKGLTTWVGFDLRFDPGLRKARELLAAGALGRLVSIHAQVGQYLPDWRPHENYRQGVTARRAAGGGVILELIHEFDYVRWLAGPVAGVAASADHLSRLDMDAEDTAAVLLRFASGAIGVIQLDCVQRAPSRSCRIVGEEGTILWDGMARRLTWHTAAAGRWQEFAYTDFDRNDRDLAEMRHVVAAWQGAEPPAVDVAEGAEVLKLALLARASAAAPQLQQVNAWIPPT